MGNENKLIRPYLPGGTDSDALSDGDIKNIRCKIKPQAP